MGRFYSEEPSKHTTRYLLGMAFCLLISLAAGIGRVGWASHVDTSQLTLQTFTISKEPELIYTGSKHSIPVIVFRCMNVVKEFGISDPELECVNTAQLLNTVRYNDTVTVSINASDYVYFNDLENGPSRNEVVTIAHNGVEYIGLECRNEEAQRRFEIGMWMGMFGVLLCVSAVWIGKEPEFFGVRVKLGTIILFLVLGFGVLMEIYWR